MTETLPQPISPLEGRACSYEAVDFIRLSVEANQTIKSGIHSFPAGASETEQSKKKQCEASTELPERETGKGQYGRGPCHLINATS